MKVAGEKSRKTPLIAGGDEIVLASGPVCAPRRTGALSVGASAILWVIKLICLTDLGLRREKLSKY